VNIGTNGRDAMFLRIHPFVINFRIFALSLSNLAGLIMKPRKVDMEKLAAAMEKMAAQKRMINDHIAKGGNLSDLKAKGIHFVKPVSL
jgi:hypothetical protein